MEHCRKAKAAKRLAKFHKVAHLNHSCNSMQQTDIVDNQTKVALLTKETKQLRQAIANLTRKHTILTRHHQKLKDKYTNAQKELERATNVDLFLDKMVAFTQRLIESVENQQIQNTNIADIQHKPKLSEIYKLIGRYLKFYNLVPPHPWQIRDINHTRKQHAIYKSSKYVINVMKWHTKHNNAHFNLLLKRIIKMFKPQILKWFNWKNSQMNVQQSSALQAKANLTNQQIRLIQKTIRADTGNILFTNEKKILSYQKEFKLYTSKTTPIPLAIVTKNKSAKEQMPEQVFMVYQADIRDATQKLITSILNGNRFYLAPTLPQSYWYVECGYDKATSGNAESIAVAISKNYHGKYGSLLTMFVASKAKDNYMNMLTLAKSNCNRDIVNRMVRWPNVIIICKLATKGENQISMQCSSYVMTFNSEHQQFWDSKDSNDDLMIDNESITNESYETHQKCMCLS